MTGTYAQQLRAKAKDRSAVIGIVGLGYVGLPLAMEMAEAGYKVIGFDVSERVVALLNRGESHIHDVPAARVKGFVGTGKFSATTDFARMGEPDCIAVCVPTPLTHRTLEPDMSFINQATASIAKTLRAGQAIVLESTTYPGTTREDMLPPLEKASGLTVGKDFFLAFSPERVDPGNARYQTRNTPKVIGGITPTCTEVVAALYQPAIETLVLVSKAESAEMVKLMENIFRSVNIGLVNEMAIVCDMLGIDAWEVIDAAATKPFGFMKFTPGPGVGGHCIPLDPHYLGWKMEKKFNYKTEFIELAGKINRGMPEYWVKKVAGVLNDAAKPLKGSHVLVLGVAYKKNIDDVRESPALEVIRLLEQGGANVQYSDPHIAEIRDDWSDDVPDGQRRKLRAVALTEAALKAADCAILVTDHDAFDYPMIARFEKKLVDTRHIVADKARAGKS